MVTGSNSNYHSTIKGIWWWYLKILCFLIIFSLNFPKLIVFKQFLQTLTMAAPTGNFDPSNTTNEENTSHPLLKIQSTNLNLLLDVTQYPKQLEMLIVALNHSALSTIVLSSFYVPITWLSLVGSLVVFYKTMKIVIFN